MLKQVWSWVSSIAIACILVVFLGVFVFQTTKVLRIAWILRFKILRRYMYPSLLIPSASLPDYNDIVIIDSRVNQERTFVDELLDTPLVGLFSNKEDRHIWIKRVIGKPGDVLAFKDHKVYRNGEALDEPYIKEEMTYTSNQELVVPEGMVFVMGDNCNHSMDSRVIGFVPLDHVLGKKIW